MERQQVMIVLDLHMPTIDGYTLARLLRSDPRFDKIPIVFLTGYDSLWNRLRARLFKKTRYLLKPFTAQDILGTVSEYMHIPLETTQEVTGHTPHPRGEYFGAIVT